MHKMRLVVGKMLIRVCLAHSVKFGFSEFQLSEEFQRGSGQKAEETLLISPSLRMFERVSKVAIILPIPERNVYSTTDQAVDYLFLASHEKCSLAVSIMKDSHLFCKCIVMQRLLLDADTPSARSCVQQLIYVFYRMMHGDFGVEAWKNVTQHGVITGLQAV